MVVLFLILMEVLFSATFFTWIARGVEGIRSVSGRRIPVGSYRFDSEIGIGFGVDDTTLILRLPVRDGATSRPVRCVGVTDASTRFTVNDEVATPDALLEAYDDSIGPLRVIVNEPGRIAEIGIAAKDAPA